MKTFQVPVWFNVQAEDQEQAWERIMQMMQHRSEYDFVVNEPVEINDEEE